MRDIEGIETILANLRPHWGEIDDHFERENQVFIGLLATPHDEAGRVLKCHLVMEHYVDRFLEHQLSTIRDARLSFAQKAKLLPAANSAAAFVRPGVIQLNALRNRFAHNLGTQVSFADLGPIQYVLKIARPGVAFESPVSAIEAFTTVACAFLGIAPPALQAVFAKAFSAVRVRDTSDDSG